MVVKGQLGAKYDWGQDRVETLHRHQGRVGWPFLTSEWQLRQVLFAARSPEKRTI